MSVTVMSSLASCCFQSIFRKSIFTISGAIQSVAGKYTLAIEAFLTTNNNIVFINYIVRTCVLVVYLNCRTLFATYLLLRNNYKYQIRIISNKGKKANKQKFTYL